MDGGSAGGNFCGLLGVRAHIALIYNDSNSYNSEHLLGSACADRLVRMALVQKIPPKESEKLTSRCRRFLEFCLTRQAKK